MLKSYLRDNRNAIILLLLCTLIFSMVFYLYNLPLSAVLYGFLLCSLLMLSSFCYSYAQYFKKCETLKILQDNILASIDMLPKAQGSVENNYDNLLRELYKEYQNLVYKLNSTQTEMMDFYTLWVHQIKTPISAISLLLQEDDVAQNKQISQELFKIEQYTELVLGYLRIDNISSDLLLKECCIEKTVNQAVKKYANLFINKKIGIEILNTEKTAVSDEKWLLFVIEQLLSNALKYTNKGAIKIYTEQESLIIQDSGIGITAEDLPRIFEKSFTGFNGRMDKKATGLGLYLVKKILDKLNHKIAIESEQGVGTKVKIDFTQSNILHH